MYGTGQVARASNANSGGMVVKFVRALQAAVIAAVMAVGIPARAQDFPSKPVKIVLPFPAGVGPDIMMRLVADKLKSYWGQAVIVENRAGANGWLAAEFVKKSAADGYTLLQTDNLHFGLQPFVIKNFPFNTHKDFEPVVPMYMTHFFVCVAANSKWNTLTDLIAAAKEANAANNPLSFGSSGYASHMHLGGVMLESATGAKMKHIPYKETPQVFVSVASGDLSWAIGSPVSTEALWNANKIKYLAITAPQRLANFPDVPTVREAGGISDYELRSWVALLAPAGVPKAVVEKINAGVARALAEPDIVERMKKIQITPWFASAAQVGEAMREDEATFGAIARKENIKVE